MMYSDVRWLPLAPAAAVRSIRTARLAAGPWGTLARGAAAGYRATASPPAIELPGRRSGVGLRRLGLGRRCGPRLVSRI